AVEPVSRRRRWSPEARFTRDHTLVAELVTAGTLTPEEAAQPSDAQRRAQRGGRWQVGGQARGPQACTRAERYPAHVHVTRVPASDRAAGRPGRPRADGNHVCRGGPLPMPPAADLRLARVARDADRPHPRSPPER